MTKDLTQPIQVSIVVPVYNELANLPQLVKQLVTTMMRTPWKFELIFIDDHSVDGSFEYLQEVVRTAPVTIQVHMKEGKPGKSYSLLEGFKKARGTHLVMIDADLQYPVEAIPAMLAGLKDVDIIVANRQIQHTSRIRQALSKTFRSVVGESLLGLPVDIQSGLKAFSKESIASLNLQPTPWGFDYQFLFLAKRKGYTIGEIDITFAERTKGKSNINALQAGMELLLGALKLRTKFLFKDILKFTDYPHASERKPTYYENSNDFLYLPEIYSIKKHIYPETVSLAAFLLAVTILGLLGTSAVLHLSIPVILSGLVAALYLGLFIFKLFVVRKALDRPSIQFSKKEIAAITDAELPIYTIIIPLYQEAAVIKQIIRAMSAIDYPKDKIDLIITLEEYDTETIDAIAAANPPSWFKTLILPDVKPKTKPKALNVAFPHTKGEFIVIYDAEIVPDADQLKKAYLAFRKHADIACLQIQLDHYNANETWVTKLFNSEFSFYYDMFLPGLQRLGIPLPLSGHSSHYRRQVIEDIGAWDPYNVTEDCELGIRLYRKGYKTDMLDSRSLEEATASVESWVGQRTRWIKGFIQTTIVHLRHPMRTKNELGGWRNFIGFLVIVPGSVLVNLLNLFYWVLLIVWAITKAEAIQAFFPGPILYISVFSFLAGNFVFTYLNLLGSFRRERYTMVKYSLLSPIYWLMLAYATLKASIEIIAKPHHWSKTKHGIHLSNDEYVLPVIS
jgi:cellulose synthase/poly-beta-1,6-N-acetylglucosamine synthase-like glycosyltransferase